MAIKLTRKAFRKLSRKHVSRLLRKGFNITVVR
jgi:hypothetical protein